jgi:putative nucleotidyltransferase with HDIG domain
VLVAVTPVLAASGLRSLGVVDSPLLAAALGAALSLALYQLAADRWQRRAGAGDVLFGDLMVWGWIRRCAQQRRIADAAALLRSGGDRTGLSAARRAQLLERLAMDLEARDPYTLGHSRRVARYAALIAKRMGVPKAELGRIRTAAAVHDIGKLQTPLEILRKPGALTDAEFGLIKRHPSEGAKLAAILEDEALTEIVLRHHERLDGSGYPGALRGGEVPLGARIVAVADTFDAITSARSYRSAKPHKQALDILRAEAGTKLDAGAVDAFLSAYAGRRPFGAWIALSDLGERIAAWFAPAAVGSGTRLAAIAAGTVAFGGGAVALHVTHAGRRSSGVRLILSRDHLAAARLASGAITVGAFRSATGATRATGAAGPGEAARRSRTGARLRFSGPMVPGRGIGTRGAGVWAGKAGGRTPAGSPTSATPAIGATATLNTGTAAGGAAGGAGAPSGSGAGGPGPAGSGHPTTSPGVGARPGNLGDGVNVGTGSGRVSVGLGTGSGSGATVGVAGGSGGPSVSVGASAGQSPGAPSAGVQVSGGSGGGSGGGESGGPTVSAGVSAGPTSVGVSATVGGGHGPAGIGISLGQGPGIKLG